MSTAVEDKARREADKALASALGLTIPVRGRKPGTETAAGIERRAKINALSLKPRKVGDLALFVVKASDLGVTKGQVKSYLAKWCEVNPTWAIHLSTTEGYVVKQVPAPKKAATKK